MRHSAAAPGGKPIELIFHNIHEHGTEIMDRWMREVETRTGGRVRFTRTTGENHAAIRAADLVRDVPVMGDRYALLNLVQIPFLFPNSIIGSKVVAQLYAEYAELQKELSDVKVVGLGLGAYMAVYSSQAWGPITKTRDFKGARTRSLPLIDGFIETLGGMPVHVGFFEIARLLETGRLDATVLGILPGHQFKLADGAAPYCTITGKTSITMHPMRIYMKWDTWHSLPTDIRKTIDAIGPAGADCWFAVEGGLDADRHLVEALEYIKGKGRLVQLAPDELERWHNLARPARDAVIAGVEARGLPAGKLFDRMNELIAEYG